MRDQDADDLIRDSRSLREQLVALTSRLDGFVEKLVTAIADEEEGRGQAPD